MAVERRGRPVATDVGANESPGPDHRRANDATRYQVHRRTGRGALAASLLAPSLASGATERDNGRGQTVRRHPAGKDAADDRPHRRRCAGVRRHPSTRTVPRPIGPVTGLSGDTALVGIDFRPATGALVGLGQPGWDLHDRSRHRRGDESDPAVRGPVGHVVRRRLQPDGRPPPCGERHRPEPPGERRHRRRHRGPGPERARRGRRRLHQQRRRSQHRHDAVRHRHRHRPGLDPGAAQQRQPEPDRPARGRHVVGRRLRRVQRARRRDDRRGRGVRVRSPSAARPVCTRST